MEKVYRHRITSDRGHLVEGEDGRKYIRRLDGALFHKVDDWIYDKDERKLTRGQVAQVALAADLSLIAMLEYRTPKSIHDVNQDEKKLFIDGGPKSMKNKAFTTQRQALYEVIMGKLMEMYG